VYAMVIGRLPFCSPFKDEYHRQRMLRHIQKGLAPFHDREMAFLPSGKLNPHNVYSVTGHRLRVAPIMNIEFLLQ